jgi:NIMA (never in mitosis gene a)-related kinase
MANYAALYTEETCIGRGNFGAAMLVSHNKENGKKYIAKNVMLQGLSAKEQEGCMMEVNLLRNLDHPNIVKYKESFLTSNQLVIVMEYCEGK